MVDLFERLNDFVVEINQYPYYRTEVIDKDKGIIRVYGRDGDNEKINSVRYSKPYYSRSYIEENILPKYENCPLCKIGQTLYIKPKKELSTRVKTPLITSSVIGLLLIPIILVLMRKKLTK